MAIKANWGKCACSENMEAFIAYFGLDPSKLYTRAHTGVRGLSLKSHEKHHMQGRPPSSLQGQAAIQLTAGERWKWESTVSIDASSPAPQLCHSQSIAFRKSASTPQFEMKGLFCCEPHNDLTVKKTCTFFRGIFSFRCSKLHNMFMFKVEEDKRHSAKSGLRWCLQMFWCAGDERQDAWNAQDLHVNKIFLFPLWLQVFIGTTNSHLHILLPPPTPPTSLLFSADYALQPGAEPDRKNDFDLTKEMSDNFIITPWKRYTPQKQKQWWR